MARTVNEQEYARKRNEILDATMQLVFAKGFDRMTIQDILKTLGISSGAFYHYFVSKPALLEAFIERIGQVSEQALLPIIQDPRLSAIEKLRGFFATFDRLRLERKSDVVALGRVWYTDENALVRQKVDAAITRQRAPLLTHIVRQGIEEGIFTTPYPDQAGEIILSLLQGMGNTHARLLLSPGQDGDEQRRIELILTTLAAYMNAIERVLGAPPNSLQRAEVEEKVEMWVNLAREERSDQ
jgi:AcrR family transcriptional regulator